MNDTASKSSSFIGGPCDGATCILGHSDPVIVQRLPSSTAVYARQENGDYVFVCFQAAGWGKRESVKLSRSSLWCCSPGLRRCW